MWTVQQTSDNWMRSRLVVAAMAIGAFFSSGHVLAQGKSDIRSAVAEVTGVYQWHADIKKYVYSDKRKLEDVLSTYDQKSALNQLVDCLDDVKPSRSTLEGKPVPVGVICHETLTQLVYYEPSVKESGTSGSWAGELTPQATPMQMGNAKKAWQKVVKAKKAVFL